MNNKWKTLIYFWSNFIILILRVFIKKRNLNMNLILLVLLIVVLLAVLPRWPYSSGWGYYPSGGVGLILLILIVILLVRGGA